MAGTGIIAKAARPLVQLTNKGIRFFVKNSNLILTIVGATGVITTVVVAVKGTIKAVKLYEEKKPVGAKEIVKTTWKCFIPTIGMVILTTTAIICNGKLNAKKIAVLTSAYSGATEALKKLEEKVTEEIGPKKSDKVVTSANTEVAKANAPTDQSQIIATGKGDQLFFCASTGQWFYSDWNGIELAEMKLKKVFSDIMRNWGQGEFVPVREAQDALGLPETDMSEYMGWDTDDFIDTNETVHFVITSDWMDIPGLGRKVVGVVRFTPWPINI